MLPCTKNVNAQPRKLSIKLDFGNSNIITDVKRLTYASDWSGSISVGQVVSSYITVSIPTPSFSIAGVNVTLSMGIDDPVEWVQIGNFRIDEETIRTKRISPTKPGYTTFNAYDKLHDTVNTYSPSMYPPLSYPVSLQQICNHVCRQIGITSTNLPVNPSFTADSGILEMIDGYTMRDVLGFIAGYCGKNAYLSPSGVLDLRWFSSTSYTADGTRANIPYIGENNCTVSRLICQTQDGVITSGSGEGIYFTCPFMTQARLGDMLSSLSLTYRKADVDIPYGSFLLQSGDIITVSTTGSNLSIPIMSNSWTYDGGVSSTVTSYGVSDYQGNANNAEHSLSATRVQRQMAVYRAASDLKIASEKITGASGGYIRINFGGDGKTAALLIMDTEDISTAQNVWVFNQEGLGHFPNGYDPTAQANVALTADGWVAASRISGEMISGVGIENVDNALTTKPKIALANGCIHFTETYSYDGQTEQVTDIGKIEYLPRSGANNPATLALTCQLGNNITIGEYGYPKYAYHSQPTGTDKMHHFYGDVKFFDGVYVGDSLISSAALAEIVDSGAKNRLKVTGTTTTINNVKFEVYDGYITVTRVGTQTATAIFNIGDYAAGYNQILTGSPEGNSNSTWYIYTRGGSTFETETNQPVDINANDIGVLRTYAIAIYPNASFSTLTFVPMICDKTLYNISNRCVPYCPTLKELYDMIQNL